MDFVLPAFQIERAKTNFGSPYRTGPKTRGRRPQLSLMDLIGVALWYLKTRCTAYRLCPVFGIVPSTAYDCIDYAMEVLLKVVKDKSRTEFEVRWPSAAEMDASNQILKRNHACGELLEGLFGVMDGGRMPCADYIDVDTQNAYYEGYSQNVEVTNLFVWNCFGEIIHAGLNFPGSWHDSRIAFMYHSRKIPCGCVAPQKAQLGIGTN